MRKVIFILFSGIIFISCSATRRSGNNSAQTGSGFLSDNFLESVKKQNITNCSFFISKANIEVTNEAGKERFICTIKFEQPDRYLFSIKSRTGIEGIRAFVSKDTIQVNDRIRKKMYVGTSMELRKKFGLTLELLPVIFGDIVSKRKTEEVSEPCSRTNIRIEYPQGGLLLDYDIDCKKKKTIKIEKVNELEINDIKLTFGNFLSVGNILIPRSIELEYFKSKTTINIRIAKIERPWNGKINFIPAKGYEQIEF